MPAILFGQGNPMNALLRNEWTETWAAIGMEIPRRRLRTVLGSVVAEQAARMEGKLKAARYFLTG